MTDYDEQERQEAAKTDAEIAELQRKIREAHEELMRLRLRGWGRSA